MQLPFSFLQMDEVDGMWYLVHKPAAVEFSSVKQNSFLTARWHCQFMAFFQSTAMYKLSLKVGAESNCTSAIANLLLFLFKGYEWISTRHARELFAGGFWITCTPIKSSNRISRVSCLFPACPTSYTSLVSLSTKSLSTRGVVRVILPRNATDTLPRRTTISSTATARSAMSFMFPPEQLPSLVAARVNKDIKMWYHSQTTDLQIGGMGTRLCLRRCASKSNKLWCQERC